jgi:hypothetical protein
VTPNNKEFPAVLKPIPGLDPADFQRLCAEIAHAQTEIKSPLTFKQKGRYLRIAAANPQARTFGADDLENWSCLFDPWAQEIELDSVYVRVIVFTSAQIRANHSALAIDSAHGAMQSKYFPPQYWTRKPKPEVIGLTGKKPAKANARPKGPSQAEVLDTLKNMAPGGERIEVSKVLDELMQYFVPDADGDEEDRRIQKKNKKANYRGALVGLAKLRLVRLHDDGQEVSIFTGEVVADEEFDDAG